MVKINSKPWSEQHQKGLVDLLDAYKKGQSVYECPLCHECGACS